MRLAYRIMPGCPIERPIKGPAYDGDVGYDLGAAISQPELTLWPEMFADIPTYVQVELPPNVWADVRPRSSTFSKRHLMVMGGTIDNGYRGMLSVFVFNPNDEPVTIHQGDYLAQLVLCPIITPTLVQVNELTPSTRGEKGFGSSGGFREPPPPPKYSCATCKDTGHITGSAGSGMIGCWIQACPTCQTNRLLDKLDKAGT